MPEETTETTETTTEETTETTTGETKKTVCADREGYVRGRTAEGKTTINCGDSVAECLAGVSLQATYNIAAELLEVTAEGLRFGWEAVEKSGDSPHVKAFKGYGHLNVGMQRMSLGNKIRGAVNKDVKLKEPTGLIGQLRELTDIIHEANQAEAAEAAEEAEAAEAAKAA